jgi:outer membrane protein TolC
MGCEASRTFQLFLRGTAIGFTSTLILPTEQVHSVMMIGMKLTLQNRTTLRARLVRTSALALGVAAFLCLPAASQQPSAGVAQQTPEVITLEQAIQRAKANEPAFAAALAQSKVAGLDRWIAKSALLPGVTYHNQFLYTQPNGEFTSLGQGAGTLAAPRFIANNAVHEYMSQAVVNELIGLKQVADIRLANAFSAQAAAELEVARRGLVVTVVGLYYGAIASDGKLVVAKRAADEANDFTNLTQKRENAREVARADVVKAQLQQQQRQRDLADATLTAEKMHLELGVLLFPDPRTSYSLQTPGVPADLGAFADVQAAATRDNPELRSALASLKASDAGVLAARAAYLPDLGLNVTYGIDAAQFAVKGPNGTRNLGYSASATLDIPIWDWFATGHKVRQSEIRRDAARVSLTAIQRQLIAHLQEFYSEANVARDQMKSLEESAQTAAESLRLTKLRYGNGEATVLEVVDAQNSLTLAENARADGMIRYEIAIANLQTLTGAL